MAIADTGKADNQPLSPEVWEAQQQELERLSRRVAELEAQNARQMEFLETLHTTAIEQINSETERIGNTVNLLNNIVGVYRWKVESKETPQNPPICLQEPPATTTGGDSTSSKEYGGYFVVGSSEYNLGYTDGCEGLPCNPSRAGSTKGAAIYNIGYSAGMDEYGRRSARTP